MPTDNARFQGVIPELYHRHLGPVIFEPPAKHMAALVASFRSNRVLETACGTGILTRRLHERLPNDSHIVATDLNQPMIDFAQSQMPNVERITWRQADASALPFSDKEFDIVVCQFGLMFVPDKDLAIREARRVLKRSGVFVLSVWDRIEKNPFGQMALETISTFFPNDPPTFFQVPFSCHDRDLLKKQLESNGFGQVKIETAPLEAQTADVRSFATGLVKGNPVSMTIAERGMDHESIIDAVAAALVRVGGAEPFRSPIQAIVVSATPAN